MQQELKIDRWLNRAVGFGLLAILALAVCCQFAFAHYLEWGDESETIVASKMLAAGMRLYGEVFNHHGPLTFLPGVLLEYWGSFGVSGHRYLIAGFQLLALLSIYRTPLSTHVFERRVAVAISAVAIMALLPEPELYGHTYTYQVLAGLLTVVILSQYALPAILEQECLGRSQVFFGNAMIACLPFLAVTYLPAAILLAAATMRRQWFRLAVYGLLTGILANLVFLGLIGSFSGFWVDHFYLNSSILSKYSGQSALKLILTVLGVISFDINFLGVSLAFFCLIAWLLEAQKEKIAWRSVLLAGAIISYLMRGYVNHGSTFWYSLIALAALLFSCRPLSRRQRMLWLVLLLPISMRLIYPLTLGASDLEAKSRRETTEFGELVKAISSKEDKIIAYSFRNFEYIAADRLPASGNFFYLPWQDEYRKNPKMGVEVDSCAQIGAYRPKIMLVDKWKVWKRFPWESYGGCIQDILDQHYQQIPGRPYYIRNDLYPEALAAFGKLGQGSP